MPRRSGRSNIFEELNKKYIIKPVFGFSENSAQYMIVNILTGRRETRNYTLISTSLFCDFSLIRRLVHRTAFGWYKT